MVKKRKTVYLLASVCIEYFRRIPPKLVIWLPVGRAGCWGEVSGRETFHSVPFCDFGMLNPFECSTYLKIKLRKV